MDSRTTPGTDMAPEDAAMSEPTVAPDTTSLPEVPAAPDSTLPAYVKRRYIARQKAQARFVRKYDRLDPEMRKLWMEKKKYEWAVIRVRNRARNTRAWIEALPEGPEGDAERIRAFLALLDYLSDERIEMDQKTDMTMHRALVGLAHGDEPLWKTGLGNKPYEEDPDPYHSDYSTWDECGDKDEEDEDENGDEEGGGAVDFKAMADLDLGHSER